VRLHETIARAINNELSHCHMKILALLHHPHGSFASGVLYLRRDSKVVMGMGDGGSNVG